MIKTIKFIIFLLMMTIFTNDIQAKNNNAEKVLTKIGYSYEEISRLTQDQINHFSDSDLKTVKSNVKYFKIDSLGIQTEVSKLDYETSNLLRSSYFKEDSYVKYIISVEQSGNKYYPRLHVIWKKTPGNKSDDYLGLVWTNQNLTNAVPLSTDSTFINYMDSSVREILDHYTKLARFNISNGTSLSVVEILTVEVSVLPNKICGSYYHVDGPIIPASPYTNGIFPQPNGEFWWQNGPNFTEDIFMTRQICL